MTSAYYPHRNGDYVYDVTVTKDETVRLSHRYRAHLSNAERIENGRLAALRVVRPDTYGPTVSEAMRALDASFEVWRQEHLPEHAEQYLCIKAVPNPTALADCTGEHRWTRLSVDMRLCPVTCAHRHIRQ